MEINTKINIHEKNRWYLIKFNTTQDIFKEAKKSKKIQLPWESKMVIQNLIAFYKQVRVHLTLYQCNLVMKNTRKSVNKSRISL